MTFLQQHWREFIYPPLASLACMIALLLLLLAWLETDAGNIWLEQCINGIDAEHLEITGLKGQLLHNITFKRLRIRINTYHIEIIDGQIVWNAAALLEAKLHISHLSARKIKGSKLKLLLPLALSATLVKPTQKKQDFIGLPLMLFVEHVQLHAVQWQDTHWQQIILQDLSIHQTIKRFNNISIKIAAKTQLQTNAIDAIKIVWQGALQLIYDGSQAQLVLHGQVNQSLPIHLEVHIPMNTINTKNITNKKNMQDISGKIYSTGLQINWFLQQATMHTTKIHSRIIFDAWQPPLAIIKYFALNSLESLRLGGTIAIDWQTAREQHKIQLNASLPDCYWQKRQKQSIALQFKAHNNNGAFDSINIEQLQLDMQDLNWTASGSLDKQHADLQGVINMQHLPTVISEFVTTKQLKQLPHDLAVQASWSLFGAWHDAKIQWQIDTAWIKDLQGFSITGLQSKGWSRLNASAWDIYITADNLDANAMQMRQLSLSSQYQNNIDINNIITLEARATQGNNKNNWLLAAQVEPHTLDNKHSWQGIIKRLHIPKKIDIKNLHWNWRWHPQQKWQEGSLHIAKQNITLINPVIDISSNSSNIPIKIKFDGDLTAGELDVHMPPLPINNFIALANNKNNKNSINSSITAKLQVRGSWLQPILHAQANITPIDIGINLGAGNIELDYADNILQWQFALGNDIYSQGSLPVHWQLFPFVWEMQTGLQARLDAKMHDLEKFKIWLPNIEPLQGHLKLIARATDIPAPLRIDSHMSLHVNNFGIPALGLDMYSNAVADWHYVHTPTKNKNKWSGKLHLQTFSAQGSMQLHLPLAWPPKAGAVLIMEHFDLALLPEQQLQVSGHLRSRRNPFGKSMQIAGHLQADHMYMMLPPARPTATADLIWQQNKKQSKTTMPKLLANISLQIDVSTGQQARVVGKGMQLSVEGALSLRGTLGTPIVLGVLRIPTGKIQQGSIKAEVLSDSTVTFTGNINHPLLNIRLGRRVGDALVGLHIIGTANAPRTRLFSEPFMSDEEIVAILATGQPLHTLGERGINDILLLSNMLFNDGNGGILGNIQRGLKRSLGLDTLRLQGDGQGGSRLVVGKQLTEDTQINLKESLSGRRGTVISMEHRLSAGFTIFARQLLHAAPVFGLRYVRSWHY